MRDQEREDWTPPAEWEVVDITLDNMTQYLPRMGYLFTDGLFDLAKVTFSPHEGEFFLIAFKMWYNYNYNTLLISLILIENIMQLKWDTIEINKITELHINLFILQILNLKCNYLLPTTLLDVTFNDSVTDWNLRCKNLQYLGRDWGAKIHLEKKRDVPLTNKGSDEQKVPRV